MKFTISFRYPTIIKFAISCIIASYVIGNNKICYFWLLFIAILEINNDSYTDGHLDRIKENQLSDNTDFEYRYHELAIEQANLKQSCECDISNLTNRVNSLVAENEKLHKQLCIIAVFMEYVTATTAKGSRLSSNEHALRNLDPQYRKYLNSTIQIMSQSYTIDGDDSKDIISTTEFITPETMPWVMKYGEAVLEKLNTKINECD